MSNDQEAEVPMPVTTRADDDMKTYRYVAVGPDNVRLESKMIAPSAGTVFATLNSDGYYPLSVSEIATTGLNLDLGALLGNRPMKMKPQELAAFARQLHQLLKAGMSVPKAIAVVGEEQHPKLAAICTEMSEKVSAGTPLSEVFAEHPEVFDDVFVSYISAGEQTGELAAASSRLARMLEKRAALNLKIKGVTAYPKMVSIMIGVMVVAILVFLVPRYAAMYAQFGSQLPAPTRVLMSLSHALVPFTWHPLVEDFPGHLLGLPVPKPTSPTLYVIAGWFAVRRWLRVTGENLEIGTRVDRLRFTMPIFGKLTYRTTMYRWASTLAGGIASGLNIAPSLDLAARAPGSRWHRAVAAQLQDAVRSGRPLSAALNEHPELFPPGVRSMIRTGEDAGDLATMLDSVAEALSDEIDSMVAGLGAKIEVALLAAMGVVVGGLLVVLYLPILHLATTAGTGMGGGH